MWRLCFVLNCMYLILKCQQFEEKKAKRMGECKGRKERKSAVVGKGEHRKRKGSV